MTSPDSLERYLRLLRLLAPVRHVYLMGGFAEDALLEGKITRERSDIDLLVAPGDWEALRHELTTAGVSEFVAAKLGPGGEMLAFGTSHDGVAIEAWLTTQTTAGCEIVLPGGSAGFFSTTLPAGTFDHPRVRLEGIEVQTVSPAALCVLRSVSAETRGGERRREEDRRMLEQLRRLLPRPDR